MQVRYSAKQSACLAHGHRLGGVAITALHPNQVAVAKILDEVGGAFPTEWEKTLAAARGLGATEACLEASSTLALPGSRPSPPPPTGQGGGDSTREPGGISDSGAPEPSRQPNSISANEEGEDGGVDPDDPCAQEAPAAKRQRPPDPPLCNPSRYPQDEGAGGIFSRAFRSAAGAIGLH